MTADTSNVLKWAKANETRDARSGWRLRSLLKGERDGTVRHPFRLIGHDDYMTKIKGRGIPKRVEDAPIDTVDLDALTGIQKSVNVARLSQHLEDENLIPDGQRSTGAGMLVDLPVVVKFGGRHYLHDGHHRATAAWVRGERAIGARVVDLDGR